jgi:TolB-like protein/DNA-binding SARP family transcriptional activator/Tfp pilus assembly protein PilF
VFYLRALGGLSLTSDTDQIPASAHQRRRLTLLVRLAAAADCGVSRDRLLALFWPEKSAERAQHALDQLLYATRRDLGRHAVSAEGGQLRLDPGVVWSDIVEFRKHLAREEWEQATALYRGPFLDGVHPGGGLELEQWVEAERSGLEERFILALEGLARETAARGELQAALQLWRRRAATDRLSARGARGLVQALVLAGDRSGAIQYARTYGALVREELGIEPDSDVLTLAEQLHPRLAGSSPTDIAPPDRPYAALHDRQRVSKGTPQPTAPAASVSVLAVATEESARWSDRQTGWSIMRRWKLVLAPCAAAVLLGSALVLRASPPAHPADTTALAVLPFEDLSPDGGAEYLGDGMSEELIHALAQLPDLKVAARTSAFAFKGRHEDIRQVARSLGVSTVLEGSVRRDQDQLRVTAQLIDAATGYHLWSGRFSRRIGDAHSIQDEIARSIVRILRPQLAGPVGLPKPSAPASARAYHLYLQGRYAWNQRTASALRQSVRLFEEAIAENPGYAAAYAGLSDAHDALVDGGFEPAESGYDKAETAALRAIALDSTLADAYASLGHLKFHRWDWAGAEQDLQRALELNPGYSIAYRYYAMPLVMQGRFAEGLAMMRKAQELDPLALNTHSTMGWLLFLAGRHDDAIEQLRVVLTIDSAHVSSHARLGLSLVERGQHDEGIASLQRAVELGGDYHRSALPMLGYAYARAGRREDAEQIRLQAELGLEAGVINPYYAAALMAALGDEDRAFALLYQTFDTSRGCLIDLGVDPMMNSLRADRRYAALVKALAEAT